MQKLHTFPERRSGCAASPVTPAVGHGATAPFLTGAPRPRGTGVAEPGGVSPQADSGDFPHLCAILDRDHARLLELLADVQFLCSRRSFLSAAKVFAEFRMLFEQHLGREERLVARLLPSNALERALAQELLDEHGALRALVEQTWETVSRHDEAAFEQAMARLSEAVDAHERGEKKHLLPALQKAAADPGAAAREVHRLVNN